MTLQWTAVHQTTAARIVLTTLDLLPTGIAEGLWRHASVCQVTPPGACRQGVRMLEQHLLPALAHDPQWREGWDAAQALSVALAVRHLPGLLSTLED